jgi:hypothetical protein
MDNDEFICLRFVDRHGDTTFNRYQCAVLAEELQHAAEGAPEEARTHLGQIEALARTVAKDVHLYLKFIGD